MMDTSVFYSLRARRWLIIVATAAFWGTTVLAQSVEERLRQLEDRVELLLRENAELKDQIGVKSVKPTKTSIVPVVTPAGKVTKLAVGGFLQGQAEFGGTPDPRFAGIKDRFYFRRARIYLTGSFAEYFDFKSEIELQGNTLSAGTGQLARANEIYLGWNRYPAAVVRFGQLKSAFGAEQLLSDTALPLIERSLGSDRLTDGRQLGLSLGGARSQAQLGYLITVGNGNGSNSSANDNDEFLTSARVYAALADSPASGRLVIGTGGVHSEDSGVTKLGLGLDAVPGGVVDNQFFGSRMGWGGDVSWHKERLSISAEYLRVRFEPRNAVPAASLLARSWYVMAGWYFVPNKLQGVFRYEEFAPSRGNSAIRSDTWTVGFNWLLKGNDIKLMTNYMMGDTPRLPDNSGRWLTRIQIIY